MKKTLLILALTAVTGMAAAGDVFAQRRGGGNGGYRGGYNGGFNGGSGWGITIGNGGVRYYSGNDFNRGYYGGNIYGGNYVSPYYYGSNYSSVPYYYGTQQYYSSPIIQQSGYYEPAVSQQSASVLVKLPQADARVWFDGAVTSQQGTDRMFNSPALEPKGTYTYMVRASWIENGRTIERDRSVSVRPGQTVTVDFRADSAEGLQIPQRSK